MRNLQGLFVIVSLVTYLFPHLYLGTLSVVSFLLFRHLYLFILYVSTSYSSFVPLILILHESSISVNWLILLQQSSSNSPPVLLVDKMKFPSFASSKPASEVKADDVPTTSVVNGFSKDSSLSDEIEKSNDTEKRDPHRTVSRNPSIRSNTSQNREKPIIETTPAEEAAAADNLDGDEIEYPGGTKLAIITLALCLSVFCMALVCSWSLQPQHEASFLEFRPPVVYFTNTKARTIP